MRTALIFFAFLFTLGLIVWEFTLEAMGNVKGSRDLDVLIYLPILMIVLAVLITVRKWLKAAERKRQDTAEGVVAAWGNARITKTELVDGYQSNAPRYPLAGLVATISSTSSTNTNVVFDQNGQLIGKGSRTRTNLCLTIQGPHTRLVYDAKNVGVRSVLRWKKLADQLNTRSRELQALSTAPAAPLTVSQPAPGWYPNPRGRPGTSYWDGRAWDNGTLGV